MAHDIPVNVSFEDGDVLQEAAFANPVNLVGVMGRGLAKAVADRWPACVPAYREALREHALAEGRVSAWRRPDGGWILQAPTKRHWRNPSPPELVAATVQAIAKTCERHGIRRIGVPPLGCGLGGLRRADVLPLVLAAARDHPGTTWALYRWQDRER